MKEYHYFVYRCEESAEARGRTNQNRAAPCGRWSVHKTRDDLSLKPRARCCHDHGNGATRRQVLTEANVAPENRFDGAGGRWKALARAEVLNDRIDRKEAQE